MLLLLFKIKKEEENVFFKSNELIILHFVLVISVQ